jgi:hypothetical protein
MRTPLAHTVVGTCLGLLLSAGAGCAQPTPPAGTPPPELTLHQVTFHTYRGSQRVAVGTASRLTYERTSGDAVATSAEVHFVSAAAQPQARHFRLEARQITGNVPAQLADAEGDVTLHDDQGLTGVTQRAHLDGKRSIAQGVDPLTLRGPGYRADAVGFQILLDQDELTLNGPVKSRFGDKR